MVPHSILYSDFFTSYRIGDFSNVRMGNGGILKIGGIEDIFLETSIGDKLVLKDVRHVPDIHLNLISTSKLADEGFTNSFNESKWSSPKAL